MFGIMDGVGTFFNLTALISGERSIDTQSALLSSWPGAPTRVLLWRVGMGFLWVWLGFACVADLAFAGCRGRRWIPFSFSPYSVFEFFLSGLWMDRPKEIVQMGLCVVEVWEWRKR